MKIINVVSGKGGTGKTLVVSVLAELLSKRTGAKVLVIDVDIFVRGLTTLLFYEQGQVMNIVDDKNLVTVSDALTANSTKRGDPAIIKDYRAFDVWPAIAVVDEPLDWKVLTPPDEQTAKIRLDNLTDKIPHTYDFVFLDSRAGFDGLIAATYQISDVVLSVADDDIVGNMTSSILMYELKKVLPAKVKRIYRIVNKCLDVNRPSFSFGYEEIGRIPFDADIMASYGSVHFWPNITRSLIEPALVEAWNTLCKRENWPDAENFVLKSRRQSLFPSANVDRRLGQLTSTQRFMAVYGLLFLFIGGFISLGGTDLLTFISRQPSRLYGAGFALFGAILLSAIFARFLVRGAGGSPTIPKRNDSEPSGSSNSS